jgi:tetratricopeptide (TPR) repeat protein
LELNRNLAHAHAFIGAAKTYIGRAEETEAHMVEAMRLSPRDTYAYAWMHGGGFAKLLLRSYEHAVERFRRAIEANRNYPTTHFQLAAAFAQLDRANEARSAAKAGLALDPGFTIARTRVAWTALSDHPTYLEQLEGNFDGLRKAGLPEE